MPFQSTVALKTGFGVPGEFADTGPRLVQPFNLVSALASYNVFGRGFSITSEGTAAAGNTGSAKFAGILVSPKESALLGTSGDTLAPSLQIANNKPGQLCTMGGVIVSLPAAAAIGDLVVYDNTTGILTTITPSTSLPAGKSPAYAFVDVYTVPSGGGYAVIRLQPSLTYVPAA